MKSTRRYFIHGQTGNLLNLPAADVSTHALTGYHPITEAAYWRRYRKYQREAAMIGKPVLVVAERK